MLRRFVMRGPGSFGFGARGFTRSMEPLVALGSFGPLGLLGFSDCRAPFGFLRLRVLSLRGFIWSPSLLGLFVCRVRSFRWVRLVS